MGFTCWILSGFGPVPTSTRRTKRLAESVTYYQQEGRKKTSIQHARIKSRQPSRQGFQQQMDMTNKKMDSIQSIQSNQLSWVGTLHTAKYAYQPAARWWTQSSGHPKLNSPSKFGGWSSSDIHRPFTSPGWWLLRPQNLWKRTFLYHLVSFMKPPRVSTCFNKALASDQVFSRIDPVLISMNLLNYKPSII